MEIKNRQNRLVCTMLSFFILIFFVLLSLVNINYFCHDFNPDLAAEPLLAREIINSKQWVPSSWFSGSEVRIIYTANFASLFYLLCGNLNLSMGLACILLSLLICITAFDFGKNLGWNIQNRLFFILFILVFPITQDIHNLLYTQAGYYAPHTALLLFSLSTYSLMISSEDVHPSNSIVIRSVLCLIFSFITGLQGNRELLVLYIPLLCVEFLRIIKKCILHQFKISLPGLVVPLWVLLQMLISYFGTRIFACSMGLSRNLRHGIHKLINTVIPEIGDTLGISSRSLPGLIIIAILLCATVISLVRYIIVFLLPQKEISAPEWSGLALCISPILTIIAVSFTTIDSSPRYYYLIFFAMAYIAINYHGVLKKVFLPAISIILLVFMTESILFFYKPIFNSNVENTELYQIGEQLKADGYYIGYSTFNNAGTISVYMNGEICVAAVENLSTMKVCKCLTSKDWFPPVVPVESKTAYVVPNVRAEDFKEFLSKDNRKEKVFSAFKTENYEVYYSNYNFSSSEE